MRIRPAFLWTLLGFFLFVLILAGIFLNGNGPVNGTILYTMLETKDIAFALKQHTTETGNLTNIDKNYIFQAIYGTNYPNRPYGYGGTNSQGDMLDFWGTPFQYKILTGTNFIIHSAGPNKNFGDADDIIFNSAIGFVKQ
jgi:hypothetical protein